MKNLITALMCLLLFAYTGLVQAAAENNKVDINIECSILECDKIADANAEFNFAQQVQAPEVAFILYYYKDAENIQSADPIVNFYLILSYTIYNRSSVITKNSYNNIFLSAGGLPLIC